jgi:transposase
MYKFSSTMATLTMANQILLCKYCNSSEVVRYGIQSGRSKFRCKECGRIFKTDWAYEPGDKEQIADIAKNGGGIRDTAKKILGIGKNTVISALAIAIVVQRVTKNTSFISPVPDHVSKSELNKKVTFLNKNLLEAKESGVALSSIRIEEQAPYIKDKEIVGGYKIILSDNDIDPQLSRFDIAQYVASDSNGFEKISELRENVKKVLKQSEKISEELKKIQNDLSIDFPPLKVTFKLNIRVVPNASSAFNIIV